MEECLWATLQGRNRRTPRSRG